MNELSLQFSFSYEHARHCIIILQFSSDVVTGN